MTHVSTRWRVLAVAALVMTTAGVLNAPGRTTASSIGTHSAAARPSGAATGTARARAVAALPSGFERNQGQTDRRVRFLAHGNGYTLFLTATEAVLNVAARRARTGTGRTPARATGGDVVRLRLVGANAHARIVGLGRLPGARNYLIGHNRRQWHTGVPSYAGVAYRDIYHGVTLVYHGTQRQLEYDFRLAPGVSPHAIRLAVSGVQGLRLDRAGNLVLRLPGGDLRQARPVVYQQLGGRRVAVSGRYLLRGRHEVGFAVGRHDTRAPLVIDPTLSYSTYLGGSADGSDSAGNGVAVDSAGDAYVTGDTSSTTYPTTTGAYTITMTNAGATDVFVTKLSPTGAISYSTLLGGSDNDAGYGIAVDNAGNAYVTGSTGSTNFPTTTNAYSATAAGSSDAFVTELNASGSALVYSTLLGGSDVDSGAAIALGGANRVYVTGSTSSADFPTTSSYRAANNSGAVFVAALNTAASGASSLVYSTLLGGNGFDTGSGIAVDGAGHAYVTGSTGSANFPTTTGAYSTTNAGGSDAFVTELATTGVISYSTYLGGSGDDHGQAIAVNGTGNAYVTGSTGSADFPQVNALGATGSGCSGPTSTNGGVDAFVTELNAAGSAPLYSTYLGGNGADAGYGIAVDGSGDAYVTGSTGSTNFPTTTDAYTSTNSGGADAFVAKVNATGNRLLYSSYLGGGSDDTGYGIAADNANGLYVTGQTYSTNFPTTNGAADSANSGSSSAFVARITGTMADTGGSGGMATSTPGPTCTPVPPTATNAPATATSTPVPAAQQGYYTFDMTTTDSSGNGNNGTLQGGAGYGPPKVGTAALSLNGSTAFFDVPKPLVNTDQSFSVAAVVSVTAVGTNYQTFVSVDGQNISGFFLQLRGDNQKFAIAQINTDAGGPPTYAASTFAASPNTWYYLVGVYDASAHQLRLYVNGQLQGTTAYNGSFRATGDTVVGRGKYGGKSTDFTQGEIDDVHIYNGVLTGAEIAALAGVPAPTATNTPVNTATPTSSPTVVPVTTPATPGAAMGALQGSQDAAPSSANLTAEGTADWIEWGDKPASNNNYPADYNRKANVTPQISTFAPVGYGTESLSGGGGTTLTWSDGTPAITGTNNGLGVYVSGSGNNPPSSGSGFQFTVPADTTTRELRVYVNAYKATGRLTASLGDNSAPVYSDASLSSPMTTTAGVYTLYYRASSPSQTLTVDWETAVDLGGGGVALEAATLQQATTIPPSATPRPPTATATPVPLVLNAFYKFDEGCPQQAQTCPGATALDSTGHGHTGTLQGHAGYASPGQDNSPYALSLDGSGNPATDVDVTDTVLNTAESYSVGAWVNLNDTNTFHTVASIDGQHISAFFLQYCGQCNTFAFAVSTSDAANAGSVRAQATIGMPQTGRWYFLTGVYDAANQQIKLYVDGVLQDTETFLSPFQATGHTAIGRGRFNNGPVDFVPGRIDEVRFYQGVLSDAQVAALAGTTATATTTGTSVPGTTTGTSTSTMPTATGAASTSTSVAATATGTQPAATATNTAAPATATNTPVPATNTAMPTNTATNTPTNTATNTAVAATATGTPVAAMATKTVAPPTATATATATRRPGLHGCTVSLLLLRSNPHRFSRPTVAVEGLRTTRGEGSRAVSSTPLFFSDGRLVAFFSYRSYRSLACGIRTRIDVRGTIAFGTTNVRGKRHIYLRGAAFRLRVTRDPLHRKRPTTFSVRVQIPVIGFDRTYRRLRGVIDVQRR